MAVTEQHFIGFDPANPFIELPGCPIDDTVRVAVWFESWSFTGWTFFYKHNTGIGYLHAAAVFDIVGNYLGVGQCAGIPSCSFSGNRTSPPGKPPTNDEWLAMARAACAPHNLPPPGTVQWCDSSLATIGTRNP